MAEITNNAQLRRTIAPSVADLVFGFVVFLLLLFGRQNLLNSDGDPARHIRIGVDILANGSLPGRYQYTYLLPDKPFLPFEWGTEVIFGLFHRMGGLAAVSAFAVIVIACAHFLIVLFLRRREVDALLALGIGFASIYFAAVHWVARPHLFTLLGAILLLFLLEPRGRRRSWLAFPLFVVWANLHGGFSYGLVLIALYIAGDLAEMIVWSDRPVKLDRLRYHVFLMLAALIGGLVNPFGWKLFEHVFGFFGAEEVLIDNTREFTSPNFHLTYMKGILGTLVLIVCLLAVSTRRPSFPRLFVVAANLGFLLFAIRNVPLFGVVALPLLALHFDAPWKELKLPLLRRLRAILAFGDSRSMVGIWSLLIAFGIGGLAAVKNNTAAVSILPRSFDSDVFPVAAVNAARAAGLEGRVFNYFIWGGYLLYAWPEQKVFIDGGTDFYGPDALRTYLEIITLQPRWRTLLDDCRISVVLMPRESPISHQLEADRSWAVWYRDRTAVVIKRTADQPQAPISLPCTEPDASAHE